MPEPTMHCHMCPDVMPVAEAIDHLRVMHPDQYGDGPERWPDGQPVLYDTTLEPRDFGAPL